MKDSIGVQIKRALKVLTAATVVLYLIVGGVSALNYHNQSVTEDALCALRADLERRVEGSEKFLKEHPNGIKGISRATILTGIKNQEATIKALNSLSC